MRVLQGEADLDDFFRRLGEFPRGVLLLDYDGTLAPFRENRHEADPYPGVRERLATIQERGRTELVLVSGRPAQEVADLLGMERAPVIWGCHGWERRCPEGSLHRIEPGPTESAALKEAMRAAGDWVPVDRIEHKGAAVAVHFRGLGTDDQRKVEAGLSALWSSLADGSESLELRAFDGGLELRAGDRDKGSAVREILEGLPDPSSLPAAYLGDDLTDEDAFEAIAGLGGLPILVRDELRSTVAHLWIRPPSELLDFLDRWASTPGTTE